MRRARIEFVLNQRMAKSGYTVVDYDGGMILGYIGGDKRVDMTHFEEFLGRSRVQPLAEKDDPRGEEYGRDWQEEGDPVDVYWRKVSASEQWDSGKSDTTIAYRFYYVGSDGFTPVSEKMRIRFWDNPDVDEETFIDLDVLAVAPYQGQNLIVIDAEQTT